MRSFAEFDQDLAYFMKDVVLPDCAPPYIAVAHSMGGHILLRNASKPNLVVLAHGAERTHDLHRREASGRVARRRAHLCGDACRRSGSDQPTCRGGRDRPIELDPFEGNPLTSDRDRYLRNQQVLVEAPQLGLGSPTVAWLRAAYRSMARLRSPDYPLSVEVPLLLFAAGMDSIVSTQAIEEFALRLKVGTHVLIPQAHHEILQETDEIRQRFWAAFDAYMGADSPGRLSDAAQDGQRLLVHARIAGGHDAPAVRRGFALPGRDAPARAFDDRNQRHHVVGFQAGLDDQVDEARGEQAIGVAIPAVAGHARRCA